VNVPLEQVADISFSPQYARMPAKTYLEQFTIEAKNLNMTAEDMVPILEPEFDKIRAKITTRSPH